MNEKLLKTYFGLYSTIAPKSAANTSFNLFQKVRKKDVRPREEAFYKSARHKKIDSVVGTIDTYCLGDISNPIIVLVHGWDSNAGSMSKIAFKMVDEGYQVLLFNLPGHAFDQNDKTNLVACSLAMEAVLKGYDLKANFSIISHSFGSAVTAICLANTSLKADKIVFLTNPNRIEKIFNSFQKMIGINKKSYKHLVERVENILGKDLKDVTVANNLEQASYNKLFIIHDKHDRVLDYSNSLEIIKQIPSTHLETFERIGHYKMLWNDEVIDKCLSFMKE